MAVEATGTDSGQTNAPIGAEPVQTPVGQQDPTPTAIELKDDLLIKDPKTGQPVKFSEYNRTFQSQFTRASQEAARLKQQLEQEQRQREAYERQVQQFRQAAGQPTPQQGIFEKLKALPYLNGEAAAEMVQTIGSEIAKRDQVLTLMANKLMQAEKVLSGLYSNHTNQSFDSKIQTWVRDLGYNEKDPGIVDLAKDVYLAYEGADLDQEFPRIFKERLTQIEQLFENRRKAALQAARRGPFLPGKGGNANPSKPLEINPKASPREIADQLWGAWGSNET